MRPTLRWGMPPVRTVSVLLFLLLGASSFARAEFRLSDPEPGLRIRTKLTPQVAKVAEGYVVVWTETGTMEPTAGWTAASLMREDGSLIRSLGAVPRKVYGPLFPGRIAASPDRVVVPGECISSANARSVCIMSIEPEGSIGAPVFVEADAVGPSVAWNGQEFLLTYVSGPFSHRLLRARVIDASGAIGEPFTIGPWDPHSHTPAVAAANGFFYVAWHRSNDESVLAEVRGGEVRATTELGISRALIGAALPISLTAFGNEIAVVASDGRMRRYRGLEPLAPWVSLNQPPHRVFLARAVRIAGGWAIAFAADHQGTYDIRLIPVGVDGSLGEEAVIGRSMKSFTDFDTISSPESFVLAWSRLRASSVPPSSESDVMFRSVESVFHAGEPTAISIGPSSQSSPVGAWGGGAYLVGWSERIGERWSIRGRRFASSGEPIGPPISFPISSEDQIRPSIAFNGESFFLVWSEGPGGWSRVRGARISADGAVLDPGGIIIAGTLPVQLTDPVHPRIADVAWAGSHWIVASEGNKSIELRRFAPNGVLLDPVPLTVAAGRGVDRIPNIDCSSETGCLLVWQILTPITGCQFTCPQLPDTIVALRIDRHLAVTQSEPIRITDPYPGGSVVTRNVDLAWNDMQRAWMVTWSGPSGRRVSGEGVLIDPPGSWGSASFTSVIAEGVGWRVLWGDDFYGRSVVAGWTTRSFRKPDLHRKVQLGEEAYSSLEVFLVPAPRPLALWVGVDFSAEAAHRIRGEFLDEVKPPMRSRLVAR
ncbi:MAG TPA: hypothetical protein VM557_09005 [Thermoanaerobaculia bacterium]|nr:hypothetical protein [Thermoanaerobaculia bacterium]